MEGIVAQAMGMQAQAMQQAMAYALMNKAMASETQMMSELLEQLPDVAAKPPMLQGELGFNIDVFA